MCQGVPRCAKVVTQGTNVGAGTCVGANVGAGTGVGANVGAGTDVGIMALVQVQALEANTIRDG